MFCPRWIIEIALNFIMILHDEDYAFFVAFKKNKTYALRWTNQQSKSRGIRQKKSSGPLPKWLMYLPRRMFEVLKDS